MSYSFKTTIFIFIAGVFEKTRIARESKRDKLK
jgi:hypothetical protein